MQLRATFVLSTEFYFVATPNSIFAEFGHNMSEKKSALQLSVLIGGCLVVWAIAGFFTHGPAILAYIGFQLVTSGVFVWQMRKTELSVPKRLSGTSAVRVDTPKAA